MFCCGTDKYGEYFQNENKDSQDNDIGEYGASTSRTTIRTIRKMAHVSISMFAARALLHVERQSGQSGQTLTKQQSDQSAKSEARLESAP